jgi:outer membrane lipoprotein carrier protein
MPCAFVLVMCFSRLLSAQDQPAHALAQLVDSHYNKLHSLRAGFTESYKGLGIERTESGTLLMLKPGRMRWDYAQPAGKLFLIDGKYAWFYAQGSAQVQRIPAKELDDLRSPLRFLLGHTQLAKELTNLQLAPAENGAFVLSGIPKNMEKRIASFSITAGADGVIQSMRIEETDGAINTFSFSDEQPNASATDADFVFHAPAGTHVIEGMPPV